MTAKILMIKRKQIITGKFLTVIKKKINNLAKNGLKKNWKK